MEGKNEEVREDAKQKKRDKIRNDAEKWRKKE